MAESHRRLSIGSASRGVGLRSSMPTVRRRLFATTLAAIVELTLISIAVCSVDGRRFDLGEGRTFEVELIRSSAPPALDRHRQPSVSARASAVDPARPAPPSASGLAAEAAPPPTSPGHSDADLREVLAQVSRCAAGNPDRLSEDQRRACDAQLAAVARRSPVIDVLPAEKRKTFDAVAKAYQLHHAPMPVAIGGLGQAADARPGGPIPGGERWRAPEGAHLPSLRCTLALGPAKRDRKVRPPPHSLVLGPCALRPGTGVLTEEADIP